MMPTVTKIVLLVPVVSAAVGFIQAAIGTEAASQVAQVVAGGFLGTQGGLWLKKALVWQRRGG